MKFLCVECDERMEFEQREVPGDGTFTAAFVCPSCGRRIALLANPWETRLVQSLGVEIGGRTLDEQPLGLVRRSLEGRDDAFEREQAEGGRGGREGRGDRGDRPQRPTWSPEARERLDRVPNFVRGMVMKIYGEYAAQRGIVEITPEVMDRARGDLGLEGM